MLERWLRRFTGLYFAAMPGLVDTTAGDVGGGDAGAGDDGGGVVVDEPTVTTGDEAVEGAEETLDDVADEPAVEGEAAKPGRPADPIRAGLDKLREKAPKLAAILRKEHFANVDYRSTFPTPVEAKAAKEFINFVGGEEGFNATREQADQFASELTMLSEGDPRVLDDFVRDSPEGFKKLIPQGIEKMRQMDPQGFDKLMARPMAQIFREKGVYSASKSLLTLIQAGKQQEAFDLASRMDGMFEAVDSLAQQSTEQPLTDKEKAIQKREQSVQSKEESTYRSGVAQASVRGTNAIIHRHLSPLLKGKTLNQEQKQDLASGVYAEISKSLSANAPYQRQMEAYYKKHAKPEEISRYVASKVEELAEKATKAVWARKGWSGNGTGQRAPGAAAPTAGTLTMSKPPEMDTVDWSKDRNRMEWIAGRATLLSGKKVTFKWN